MEENQRADTRRKQCVTATDIARACGVSQATVSYVINDKPGKKISASTRALILDAAARMGYVPSATARSMRTSRAMSIGVVTGHNDISIGFRHALKGIKSCLDREGYSITLLNGEEGAQEEKEYLSYYFSGRVDGFLFLFLDLPDSTLALLQKRRIPYLMVSENGVWGDGMAPRKAYPEAVRSAACYCREKGYRSVRFFSFRYGEALYSYKYNLFSSAMAELCPDIPLRRTILQTRGKSNEALMEEITACLNEENFDLAVTPNQWLGWLMQSCILGRRFILPQTVAHICLAFSHAFQLTYPTVTSIDIPLTEIGEFAAAQLIRILSGLPPESRDFTCSLKPGMSTEYPPAGQGAALTT